MTVRPVVLLLMSLALPPGSVFAQTRFLSPQWAPVASLANPRRVTPARPSRLAVLRWMAGLHDIAHATNALTASSPPDS